MASIKKICVFCSSSEAVDNIYIETAISLGNILAQNNYDLIYGGANVGLMRFIAETVHQNNGFVHGIIPIALHDKKLAYPEADIMDITTSMSERKSMMNEFSDAFIALPGGFGTLEEILETITLKQLEYHKKPIVFLNTNNFYSKLFELFEQFYDQKFSKSIYRELYTIVSTPEEAIDYIKKYKYKSLDKKWFDVSKKEFEN